MDERIAARGAARRTIGFLIAVGGLLIAVSDAARAVGWLTF